MKIQLSYRSKKNRKIVFFFLRDCFVKMTYNILMKTSEEISKHMKPISSLKMAGRVIRFF